MRLYTASLLLALVVLGAPTTVPHAEADSARELAVGAMANFIVHDDPKPAVDDPFKAADGRELRLSDFKGRVVLLNFWATWCAPCRREMSDLDELQGELGGPRFEVVALSSDRQGFRVIEEFYAEEGLKHLRQYNDPRMKVQRGMRAYGLPTTLLLDAAGMERGRLVGPADWASPEAKALIRFYLAAEG